MSFLFCNEGHLSVRVTPPANPISAVQHLRTMDLVSLIVDGDCLRAGCCGPAPKGQ